MSRGRLCETLRRINCSSAHSREPFRIWSTPILSRKKIVEFKVINQISTQVLIKNLQSMHEKSLPPTGAPRRIELSSRIPRLGGLASQCKAEDHTRADTTIA